MTDWKSLKKLSSGKYAIGLRVISPKGTKLELITDLPDELAEEIIRKVSEHMGKEKGGASPIL